MNRKKYLKSLKKAWMAYARKQELIELNYALIRYAEKSDSYVFNPDTQTVGYRPSSFLKHMDDLAINGVNK